MRGRILVLLGALIATRCTSAGLKTHHFLTGEPAPIHRGPVGIFMEGAPLPAGYAELGLVQVVGGGKNANIARLLPALQDEAASIGGNAVILVRVDQGAQHASATGVAVRAADLTDLVPAPPSVPVRSFGK
jgi:hypothetical protein